MAATTINWFTSSLIVSLFFLMHVHSKDFSAFAHPQQAEIETNGNEFGQNAVYIPHKEISTDGASTVVTRKLRQPGGRKMIQVQDVEVKADATQISGKNDEDKKMRERLDGEANKMVKLMHRDYLGMDKPRRKPPVNNDEPSD